MSFYPDGTVISSSQIVATASDEDSKMFYPMVGIILAVQPSDNVDNLTSSDKQDDRGWRHECSVLIVDANGEPNLILENVVIPPDSHSGIDSFAEDLPKGLGKKLLNGKNLPDDFAGIDFNDLDVTYCVISYIGGSIDKPFISNWWYHPRNNYDPATTGAACLKQVDIDKNKFRKIRRINGTFFLVNQNGDVYIDTSSANSKISIKDERPVADKFVKGGSIQVNIKASQQLEFNWNESVEGLASGSNSQSQSRDPALPHFRHTDRTPTKRDTSRTFMRTQEYSHFLKTSSLNLFCENTEGSGGKSGDIVALAQDQILLTQQEDGDTASVIDMSGGGTKIVSRDGDTVTVGDDQITLANKSGSRITLNGGSLDMFSGSGGTTTTALPVNLGTNAAKTPSVTPGGTGLMLGGSFVETYAPFIQAFAQATATLLTLDAKSKQTPVGTIFAPQKGLEGFLGTWFGFFKNALMDHGGATLPATLSSVWESDGGFIEKSAAAVTAAGVLLADSNAKKSQIS